MFETRASPASHHEDLWFCGKTLWHHFNVKAMHKAATAIHSAALAGGSLVVSTTDKSSFFDA